MAWNPQQQGYNPNAPSWQPQGYGQGFQQQQQAYQQWAGYPPQAAGYAQQPQAFYGQQYATPTQQQQQHYAMLQQQYAMQQQQYGQNPYQAGVSQGAQPFRANPPVPEQPQQPPEPPQPSAKDLAKLQLGGAKKSSDIVMPKSTKAKVLSLGDPSPAEKKEASPTTPNPPQPPAAKAEPKTEGASPVPEGAMPTTPVTPNAPDAAKSEPQKRRKPAKEYVRDPRPHFNVVFIGHVDSGKSTVSGHLLLDQGIVEEREMVKLKAEAEKLNRGGWEYAYVLDVDPEERAKGKTHETGAAYFETKDRRITLLDAPGHKAFVPSMIGGASQADIAVLVISARTGEFETGFEKGGQTREHVMLVRTCGVKQMVCIINKMDCCDWEQARFQEVVQKLSLFLKQNGYDEKLKNLVYVPTSGITGENLTFKSKDCQWYGGAALIEVLNDLKLPETRTEDDVVCMPIVGAFKDEGKFFAYGKVESGSIVPGDKLQILPSKKECFVEGLQVENTEIPKAYVGDNIHVRLRGVDEQDFHPGFVLTSTPTSLRSVEYFLAKIVILEVRNIISAGSKMMLHIHAAQEEVSFHKLLAKLDRRTMEPLEKDPVYVKGGEAVLARMELSQSLTVEVHKKFDKLGRFMLRDEGKTIAIGTIEKLYESTKESLAKKEAAATAS